MANIFKFDENQHNRSPLCTACEEMLTDALDQTLSPADQAWFDKHITSCVDCSDMLADAQRGAAWLELLKSPRPEPSTALMERIIAQTSGLEQNNSLSPVFIGQPAIAPDSAPAMPHTNLLPFRPRMPKFGAWANAYSQPRLMMTAAMAFFSIALTLNLTGVRLDQLRASNLNPTNVRKSYYEASADAVRYYDNLKVVQVMQSRVENLRTSDSDDSRDDVRDQDRTPARQPHAKPDQAPDDKATPKPDQEKKDPNGPVSQREMPVARPRFITSDEKISSTQTALLKKFTQEGGLA